MYWPVKIPASQRSYREANPSHTKLRKILSRKGKATPSCSWSVTACTTSRETRRKVCTFRGSWNKFATSESTFHTYFIPPFLMHLSAQSNFSALYKWFFFDIYWWITCLAVLNKIFSSIDCKMFYMGKEVLRRISPYNLCSMVTFWIKNLFG